MNEDAGGKNYSSAKSVIGMLAANIRDIAQMVRDTLLGEYREPGWRALLIATLAALYFLNPIDLIPDFIPVAGVLDDALVLALALKLIGGDLEKYRSWRKNRTPFDIEKEEIVDADYEDIAETPPKES